MSNDLQMTEDEINARFDFDAKQEAKALRYLKGKIRKLLPPNHFLRKSRPGYQEDEFGEYFIEDETGEILRDNMWRQEIGYFKAENPNGCGLEQLLADLESGEYLEHVKQVRELLARRKQ